MAISAKRVSERLAGTEELALLDVREQGVHYRGHPFYAVSQANGQFTIPNLPPGSYTVVAWHEKYGQQEQNITVGPKESKQISFSFKG